MLLGGLPLLLLPRIPQGLVIDGLAVWLLVESVQTIAGAFGLRRSGKMWVPWVLIGAVSGLFGVFLFLQSTFALVLTQLALAAWLFVRGASDLYVARKADEVPGRRWALVAEGALSLIVVVMLFTVPQAAGRLLRYVLGGYLVFGGVTSLAFAWSIRQAARRRVLDLAQKEAVMGDAALARQR